MLAIYDSGRAKAVGVSNYNITHIQEILDAGLRLPSLNQCPFHLYRSSTHNALRQFCSDHKVLFSGYSPLGVPDYHYFPTQNTGLSYTPMADPTVIKIASAHRVTPAQVLLQWQYALGIPTNPRSQNEAHMKDNLNAYSFTLTNDEINVLNGAAQDTCAIDSTFYECANATTDATRESPTTLMFPPILLDQ